MRTTNAKLPRELSLAVGMTKLTSKEIHNYELLL